MACTNPRHADCPNCGGEVYLEPDGSVRTTRITNRHIDRATGEVLGEDEVTLLPHHVLAPLACPTPLVTFAERIELAKAGKLPDMAKELMGWPSGWSRRRWGSGSWWTRLGSGTTGAWLPSSPLTEGWAVLGS